MSILTYKTGNFEISDLSLDKKYETNRTYKFAIIGKDIYVSPVFSHYENFYTDLFTNFEREKLKVDYVCVIIQSLVLNILSKEVSSLNFIRNDFEDLIVVLSGTSRLLKQMRGIRNTSLTYNNIRSVSSSGISSVFNYQQGLIVNNLGKVIEIGSQWITKEGWRTNEIKTYFNSTPAPKTESIETKHYGN